MNTFSIFEFINYIDFIQSQKFPNKKTEGAFKELFFRLTSESMFLNSQSDFIKNQFEIQKDKTRKLISQKILDAKNRNLSKVIKKHLFGNKIDYTLLLHFEIFILYEILGAKANEINEIFIPRKDFGYSEKKEMKFQNMIMNLGNIRNSKIKASLNGILNFVSTQKKYQNQKIFNIAVCATMSAGKSTFVNALLGNDYLPARNEATTAKITSVYDNDAQQKMIGFAGNDNKGKILELSGELNREKIDSWNSSSDVNHIYLQSDLDSISSSKVICTVHDTPGTNNSENSNHKKITMDFLESQKVDMIVFVANATQLKTTDEKKLLEEIYGNIVSKKNIPVLFVLNKADELDSEKEDLSEIIAEYSKYIEEIGYKNCEVLPVSAKAARLFKMALKGKGEFFTESECDDFLPIFKRFEKRLNFGKSIFESNDVSEEKIVIDGETYSKQNLIKNLYKTGIKDIEKYISKNIENKEA